MPSSISNSNDRLPSGPGLRIWVTALAMAVCVLIALELFWRAMGYTPTITSDEDLWAYHRENVSTAGPKTVVVLGQSRIQEGLVPEAFKEVCPDYEVIQLAIGGKHPIGTLRDLAENTTFSGIILCSITADSLLPELWDQQEDLLRHYYDHWGPMKRLNRTLKTIMQSRSTILLPDLILQRVLPDIIRGKWPVQFLWNYPGRSQMLLYERVDIEEFTRTQFNLLQRNLRAYQELNGYREWPKGLDMIEGMAQTIHSRGGKVVFLRCPTTGPYRAFEEQIFPRKQYWDVFATNTSAVTIHFEDVPDMAGFTCAEGSHLYWEDAKSFSRAVGRELRRLGVVEP